MVISCGQNDMKIPWKFHGNSMEFLCEKTMGYFCKGDLLVPIYVHILLRGK